MNETVLKQIESDGPNHFTHILYYVYRSVVKKEHTPMICDEAIRRYGIGGPRSIIRLKKIMDRSKQDFNVDTVYLDAAIRSIQAMESRFADTDADYERI